MNRTSATSYLTEKYRELATDAEFESSQITAAYNGAIDMSLRQLGVAESDLATADVAQASVMKYLACLDYYALSRFALLLSIRFDVAAGQGALDVKRSQAFDRVNRLKAEAAADLAQYGILVSGSEGSTGIGFLNLDFLEPSSAGEF